jgi:hypothetical protein
MPNTEQLRNAIDTGKTGEKVAFPDPAAAPLGTDDEAAGTPPTIDQVRMALTHEYRAPAEPTGQRRTWIPMVAVLVVVLVGALLLFLLR